MTIRASDHLRRSVAEQTMRLIDAGSWEGVSCIEVYTGLRPTTIGGFSDPIGRLLLRFPLGDPPFYDDTDDEVVATPIAPVRAVASGRAGWFRICDRDGNSVVDGVVTDESGFGDLTLNRLDITKGTEVTLTRFMLRMIEVAP